MTEEKKDEPNRIMVYLRVRPAKKGEINEAEGTRYLFDLQPDNKSCLVDTKPYNYDWIFAGDDVQQEDIYQKVAAPVIDNVFKGFWGTIMVYGQTGTGKSFTMCNFHPTHEGIIPRAMRQIFETIAADTERVYTVCFSFIQIYLDKLQDLFNPEAPELKITRDKAGVQFPGIREHVVKDGDHFRELYEDGHQHRVITATKMNPESSRGHAALFIQIKSVPKDDPSGENRAGKLFLIDLAGYERFSKTGVQEGIMAQEAKTINASLLALGNVVGGLAAKSDHVPWRDAKLTRMLEDAIGGKAKCSIVLTAGPSSDHVHETISTLYFGSRAMSITTKVTANISIDYKKLAAKLQDMLNTAESRISNLEVEATRHQLEREEKEARFQQEWARVKKRQEEQLQSLLAGGANSEKIQEFIAANEDENSLLEEQHYTERNIMEERHNVEIKDSLAKEQEKISRESQQTTSAMSKDLQELQRQLANERDEKNRYKEKAKDAEAEARRLVSELNEAKMSLERGGFSAGDGDMRAAFDQKVEKVKEMLEENFNLRLQEVEEPLREELQKIQNLYENLKACHDEDIQNQKDALTTVYEQEIQEIRASSAEVQDRLKKNHMTIKKSYQTQKERLDSENEELTHVVATLTKQLQSAGITPVAVKTTSSEIPKTDRTTAQLEQRIQDMRSEMEYVIAEKEGLQKQLDNLTKTADGERMTPAQVRQMKVDNEDFKAQHEKMEIELFKLKAQMALSGPEQIAATVNDDEDVDLVEDLHGDIEGVSSFVNKLARTPHFVGAQPIPNSHSTILSTLTTDLDEMRRFLKYKVIFVGESNVGKTSFGKCLMAGSAPIIRALPEVIPTIHPSIHPVSIEDPFVGKSDWHKLYVQFQDIETQQGTTGNFFGGIMDKLAVVKQADAARLHIDIVDLPGGKIFWRSLPPRMLPGKGAIYCIMFDLTHPVDIAKQAIEHQLNILHASCSRNYSHNIGGGTPRIGFCLIGTHRDLMRDSRDSSVQAHLNKVALSLGEVFYKLRGEDNFGLVCVGSFAVSCKDWSVIGSKDRLPKTFKDLAVFLGTVATQLYNSSPSTLICNSRDTASHMTYMLGDELMEGSADKTSHLDQHQQRLRKGIVTFITGIFREQKVRWFMRESEMRKLVAEHLNVKDDQAGNNIINYLLRELSSRGLLLPVPNSILEPKYLPKDPAQPGLPRDGIIVLDPNRMLLMFSLFMVPSAIAKHPPSASYLKDKQTLMVDIKQLEKCPPLFRDGILTEQLANTTFQRMLALLCNEPKLLFEFFSILGLGLNIRSETAMLSPAHFSRPMSNLVTEYLSYLIGLFGDGVGRKYKLNASCPSFFSRLQTKLIPFSHAPTNDPSSTVFNYSDASLLVVEKSRLKWGIFGSKALKDAVMSAGVPVRGIMKIEGPNIFIALSAKGDTMDSSISIAKSIMNAIHYEVSSLCAREFRGLRASFQEMTIGGSVDKKKKIQLGIQTILTRFQIPKEAIANQISLIGNLSSDPKNSEIENAIRSLPMSELEK